ncbi:hypothetical protein [Nostoc sp.]|uniref:hypothetical protein n=1 Tax=Nostoc sp. TaxID=1180 RepID=UPI002FF66F9B
MFSTTETLPDFKTLKILTGSAILIAIALNNSHKNELPTVGNAITVGFFLHPALPIPTL